MLSIFLLAQRALATFYGIVRINSPVLCWGVFHSLALLPCLTLASLTSEMHQLSWDCTCPVPPETLGFVALGHLQLWGRPYLLLLPGEAPGVGLCLLCPPRTSFRQSDLGTLSTAALWLAASSGCCQDH